MKIFNVISFTICNYEHEDAYVKERVFFAQERQKSLNNTLESHRIEEIQKTVKRKQNHDIHKTPHPVYKKKHSIVNIVADCFVDWIIFPMYKMFTSFFSWIVVAIYSYWTIIHFFLWLFFVGLIIIHSVQGGNL